jgi:hypothetical protein
VPAGEESTSSPAGMVGLRAVAVWGAAKHRGRLAITAAPLSRPPFPEGQFEARLVDQVIAALHLSEASAFDVKVSISEACANSIEHASARVELAVWLLLDRVLFQITSDGWSVRTPSVCFSDPPLAQWVAAGAGRRVRSGSGRAFL